MSEPVILRGIYDGKGVRLLEPAPTDKECEVRVVFESEGGEEDARDRFLATFAAWEDERSFEEIVQDIYTARTPGHERIPL